jgi:hypothetical protein
MLSLRGFKIKTRSLHFFIFYFKIFSVNFKVVRMLLQEDRNCRVKFISVYISQM